MHNTLLVIIVTYNGLVWIDKCLSSIFSSTIPVNVFLVDNNSTDGTVEYIKEHYPQVKLIQSPENMGFGRANNLGFEYALKEGFKYVYLLNQDAWVSEDTFETLINVYNRNPEYGILSPLQVNNSMTGLDENFSKCCSIEMLSDCLCRQSMCEVYSVAGVMAAHWFMPVETLKTVGGFSPTFIHYGEDIDFGNRTHFNGLKIGIVPSARAVHDREFRVMSQAKKQYLFYVDNVVMLSNPNLGMRMLRLINNYAQILFKNREIFSFKYFFKTISSIGIIASNRKKSMESGAFINS